MKKTKIHFIYWVFVLSLLVSFNQKVYAQNDYEAEYLAALSAAIEEGETYHIYTEVNGIKYYLNATGYLTDIENATTFEINKVEAEGTLYKVGWNLGVKFTNPNLVNGSTGDIVNDGHIHNGNNDRDNWERQVLFMNDEGKFAVRSTNANSQNWGANTYWDVFTETELPEAGYSLEPAYVWHIACHIDLTELRALSDKLLTQTAAKDTYDDPTEVVSSINAAIEAIKNGDYANKKEVDAAIAQLTEIARQFFGAIKPKTSIDVSDWFIVNPTIMNKEGWEGTKIRFYSDGVWEYWNQSAAEIHQTITIPAGRYKLTVVALQRTDMTGYVYAGERQATIVGVDNTVANSRAQAAEWFAAGNGINEIIFRKNEATSITIGLVADETIGDHWLIWKAFKLEILDNSPLIQFSDATVKKICLQNWDTDRDDELSEKEASAITSIDKEFSGNKDIQSFNELRFFTSLSSIDSLTFSDCEKLTYISIPNNVTYIGDDAFSGCNLSTVTIPNTVIKIGTNPFSNCNQLSSIIVEPDNIMYDSREDCNAIIETASNTLISACYKTIIPNSITTIGKKAFYGCTKLTNIDWGNRVQDVGNYAFQNCSGLTNVSIPDNVKTIGENAFNGCGSLSAIKIGIGITSIGTDAFASCSKLTKVISPDLTKWFGIKFGNANANPLTFAHHLNSDENTEITSLVVPNGVTTIGQYALNGLNGLKNLTLHKNITSVATNAFNDCSGIESLSVSIPIVGTWFKGMTSIKDLKLGNNVTKIDANAFSGCTGLTSIDWGSGIKTVGDNAFYGCTSLAKVSVSDMTAWYNTDFGINANPMIYANQLYGEGNEITDLVIPEGVSAISENTLKGYSFIKSIKIPKTVTSVADNAFSGCTQLASVSIDMATVGSWFKGISGIKEVLLGTNVTKIDASAFAGCTGLTKVSIPDNIKTIGSYAFSGCSNLATVTIGNGMTSIGTDAFASCSNLTKVIAPDLAKWFGIQFGNANANPLTFAHRLYSDENTEITSLVVPNAVTAIGQYTLNGYSGLKDLTLHKDITSIATNTFSTCTGLTSVSIDIPTIGSYFKSMTGIKDVHFGENVTKIDVSAFTGCTGLTNISIPDNVKTIGGYAFSGCGNLTFISIGNGVTSIGTDAFNSCSKLNKVIVSDLAKWCGVQFGNANANPLTLAHHLYINENTEVKELVISDGVNSIGAYSFNGCNNLTSVTIGNAVNSIGTDAFGSCSKLTKVVASDLAKWFSIQFANANANPLTFAHKLFSNESTEIKDLVIPQGVTSIGQYTLNGYNTMTSISVPKSVTSIATNAFRTNTGLASVTINMATVGSWFNGMTGIKNVRFGDNVTKIDASAFSECTGLTNVSIPNNVKTIGASALSGCSNLASISIGNGVTSIGTDAFSSCSKLTKVIVTDLAKWCGIQFANANANPLTLAQKLYSDENNEITDLEIPNGVTSIGANAFNGCNRLSTVTANKNLTQVGTSAFNGCSSIQKVLVPDIAIWCGIQFADINANPLAIAHHLYNSNGSEIRDLVIPNGVKSIGAYAFQGCAELKSVTYPTSLTSIGQAAFKECIGLSVLNISNSVTSIGNEAFEGCNNIKEYHIPVSATGWSSSWASDTYIFVKDSYVTAYRNRWTEKADRIFAENASNVTVNVEAKRITSAVFETVGSDKASGVVKLTVKGTINGYDVMALRNRFLNLQILDLSEADVVANSYKYYENYSTKDNVLTAYFVPESVKRIVLPKSLKTIEGSAFRGCAYLTDITLPDGITRIGNHTFDGCTALQNIKIPSSVLSIDEYAFNGCKAMAEIHLPADLEVIGDYAFEGCSSLKDVYAYMSDIVPIGQHTFNDYRNQSLHIPDFLYNKYLWDARWSQFSSMKKMALNPSDYDRFTTNTDTEMGADDQRIPHKEDGDAIDARIQSEGSFTVEGDEPQDFATVELVNDGEGRSGSLIGDDDGEEQGNVVVDDVVYRVNVEPETEFQYTPPVDLNVDEDFEYPEGQYKWWYFDGSDRAKFGSSGRKALDGKMLHAHQGYVFMAQRAGTLVIHLGNTTVGGSRKAKMNNHEADAAQDEGWNFMGNPYASFYDMSESEMTAPITVWNAKMKTYEALRPGDDECHLQPFQAFYVQKPEEVEEVGFETENRESYRQSEEVKEERKAIRRAKGVESSRRIVDLYIEVQEQQADRTRIVVNPSAKSSYEVGTDAAKFMSEIAIAQIYTIESGVEMAINERPMSGNMPLGYTSAKVGRLTIGASRMDAPLVLVDRQTGVTCDLSENAYEFTTTEGTFNDRFLIRAQGDDGIGALTEKTGVLIAIREGGLAVGGAEGKEIQVYSIDGKAVASQSGNGFISLKPNIYIVGVDGITAKVRIRK